MEALHERLGATLSIGQAAPGELYGAWCAARDEALAAYRAWGSLPREAGGDAYCVYTAAADREKAAAEAYQNRLARDHGRCPRSTLAAAAG